MTTSRDTSIGHLPSKLACKTHPILALLNFYKTFKPRTSHHPIPSTKGAYPPTIKGPEAELVFVEFVLVVLLPFDLAARA